MSDPMPVTTPAVDPVVTVLAAARRAAGISQRDLARRLHAQQSGISDIESGKRSPTLAALRRLIDALGLGHDLVVVDAGLVVLPQAAVEALWGLYHVCEMLATVEPTAEQQQAGYCSLLTLEDDRAMDDARDAISAWELDIRSVVGDLPAEHIETPEQSAAIVDANLRKVAETMRRVGSRLVVTPQPQGGG